MITIKSMKQIPTAKLVRGFRSGGSRLKTHTGEQSRILAGYAEIQMQESRRQWLKHSWYNRETR
ncbi:hypothetical protein H6G89_03340 [Oscillatoria sp. FACHB-1407]|uniref:hypothetical protein n=1 Tax=Oscillatoria sp. FACHB-1407 TaxID=2692847 RepID=UPI001687FB88|nr:hypothetical protein [Oscillatoria sp. FACHB-1407]MBD2460071.1 hypothetical protein [Oscillatoria sp. FACHB-1407]